MSNAQTWQSISKVGTYYTTPYAQFTIDPYRNNIWLMAETGGAVIENDGTIRLFGETELGLLWNGDNLQFVFTPNHIYYAKLSYGLYSFDNYSSVLKHTFSDFRYITNNLDTVYITIPSQPYQVFTESSTIMTPYTATSLAAKDTFIYVDIGSNSSPGYYNGPNGSDFVYIESDPDFLGGVYNEKKFTRLTDTIYFGSKLGISKAYDYDFFDTITPYNTTNMPSPNVVEMEFDENDTLWAVFGDASDVPFAIAKLDGDTWTDEINAGNSPIDFDNFYGFEIDTLGNMWFVDNNSLHTILTPNSPAWLGVEDIKPPAVNIYPNPVKNTLKIDGLKDAVSIEITDLNGRSLKTFDKYEKSVDVSELSDGIYLIRIATYGGESTYRFVKE